MFLIVIGEQFADDTTKLHNLTVMTGVLTVALILSQVNRKVWTSLIHVQNTVVKVIKGKQTAGT